MFVCYDLIMKRAITCLISIVLLSACSDGFNVYSSQDKNNHYRTFARITSVEDTERVMFEVRKRHREILAEKELFRFNDGKIISLAGGKHREKDWSGGLVMRWNY